jgi:hypothetical protein
MFGMEGEKQSNLSKHRSRVIAKDSFPWVGLKFLFSLFCTAMSCFPFERNSSLLKYMSIVSSKILEFQNRPHFSAKFRYDMYNLKIPL